MTADRLAEIKARAERAGGKADCILRRYARAKLRDDVPDLVAALEVALAYINRRDTRFQADAQVTREKIRAILGGGGRDV